MTGYFTPGSVPASGFIVQTQGRAGPATPQLSGPIPDQQHRGRGEALQTGAKGESSDANAFRLSFIFNQNISISQLGSLASQPPMAATTFTASMNKVHTTQIPKTDPYWQPLCNPQGCSPVRRLQNPGIGGRRNQQVWR